VRCQRGPLYLAAGAADLDSHELYEQGRYFDGRGFMLFGQTDVTRRWFLYAAANDLRPDGSEVGEYRVRCGVLGLGYRLRGAPAPGPPASSGGIEVGAECKVEDSTASDGSSVADSVLSFFINYGW
jgi:hypothetical protein